MTRPIAACLAAGLLFRAAAQVAENAPAAKASDSQKRVELNILGTTDAAAGESRRNENIQFNLVDNNALKELNVRLGTTATIQREFLPERNYFGAEFGNPPSSPIHLPAVKRSGIHGTFYETHQNSVFSARSFFQAGSVRPAHENDFGFTFGAPLGNTSERTSLYFEGSQQKLRGSVNGNVLVPREDERTPLSPDPAVRGLIARFLAAYPSELPNRTDVNARALNTNAIQSIDNNNGAIRLDHRSGVRDRVTLHYQFISQAVDAFQLVSGQNPDTDTRSHRARATWSRQWNPALTTDLSAGFERIGSFLRPEPGAVGPMISIAGLETLGPLAIIPIRRAQNLFRYAGHARRTAGNHTWTFGFGVLRRQLNGQETDAHRGVFSFAFDFGRDAITNFRLGAPTQYIVSVGDVHRGFRNWDTQFYAGDSWKLRPDLTVTCGLRYQPVSSPREANGLNRIPYDCDCNNAAPALGIAWKAPRRSGIIRVGYGLHYGEIFPVTFQQVRFSPPGSVKVVVLAPGLTNPLSGLTQSGGVPNALGNLYLLDPALSTPYSHQYHFSWEPELSSRWKLQFGYVGSRSHKLLSMWYLNRAHAVAGIPQTTATINQRRPDPTHAETRWVVNGSRGYFDAARVSLILPRWRGLSIDGAWWLSKAMDLGSSYTNTAYDQDSRLGRSQSEFETQKDMKAVSSFDQSRSFLLRGSYTLSKWSVSAVVLSKTGIPFNVGAGSDGPGFGNVDGNGGDRPNLLDASILGRTFGNPDTSRARLPRSAFAFMNPADDRGNLGRNVFRRGGISNVNAAVARSFAIHAGQTLLFRAESINLLNTPQFAEPGIDLTNANFGQITNTLNDGRVFRFMLQLAW